MALSRSTPAAAREALIELGAAPAEAEAYVDEQLSQWLSEGYWAPPSSGRRGRSPARLKVSIDGLRAEIVCGDRMVLRRLKALFGQFPPFRGRAHTRVEVRSWAGGFCLAVDGGYLGCLGAEELGPRIKALLTERLVSRPCDGFFVHGALLARGGRTVMLSGAPRAGKTTLSLALQAAGFTLLGDDVIRVDGRGRVRGVPFAPAVKEGAWPLLTPRLPQLPAWPVELRTDGQVVRYAPMKRRRIKPRRLDLLLALERGGQGAARITPISPTEGLSILLAESFSGKGRLEAAVMAKLVQRFSRVNCGRLVYSDLDEAVAAVERSRRGG